ncbi:FirrV-1-B23 [Feldmannia irregularis virus a]|uniref:FirrV-1-B23 n=1 Tax=Feldmannia irregularis virus a TaxID=231992 RepID=Q6XM13_9PHYC|nr:FirrV-1-B23 [Feldmannia irregularis virus a]AAR26898.1 FirrV-1-B23 [Feldmannia irregularis virus a]
MGVFNLASNQPSSPATHALFAAFTARANMKVIGQSYGREVSDSSLIDTMHEVFWEEIDVGPVTVESLNRSVVRKLTAERLRSERMQRASIDMGLKRSRLPRQMLPRPSVSEYSEVHWTGY